jgi:hypothetical protein
VGAASTRALGAVGGILAGAVAIGAAQFASGLGVPESSPVVAVGQAAIDLAPPSVKDFAISAFGTNDKTALLGGILVVLVLYAAVVGMLAVRRLAAGLGGLAVFAAIGLAAALTRPDATVGYVVPALAGAAAGAVALTWLTRAAVRLGTPVDPLYLPGPRQQPGARAGEAGGGGPGRPGRPDRPSRPNRLGLPPARGRPTPLPAWLIKTIRPSPAGPRGGGSCSPAGRRRPWPRSGRWPGKTWPTSTTSPPRGTPCDSPGPPFPLRRCPRAATWVCAASARSSPRMNGSTASTPPWSCPRWLRRPGGCGSTGWCSAK